LDARTVKRTVDGKPQTRNYVVPVLDIEGTMAQIGQTDVPVAIEASRPSLTPVPAAAIPETTGLSVAEQLAVTKETPRRKNAAAVLPPTGLEPGKVEPEQPPAGSSGGTPPAAREAARPEHVGTAEVVPESSGGGEPPPPQAAATGEWFASVNKRAHAIARSVLSSDKATAEAQWDALCWQQSGGRTTSRKELEHDEYTALAARLKDLSMGKGEVVESDDPACLGWAIKWKEVA
jgi:hypothetical protein